jgi:rRNA maturation protein Nop10
MLRVGSNLGDYTIYVTCKRCGHQGKVLPPQLATFYSPETPVHPLLRNLRCSRCGARDALWKIRMKLNMR